MPATLIIAEPNDWLAQQLCDRLPDVIRCSGHELFASGKFTLFQDGTSVDGSVEVSGGVYRFEQLSGVLFRPSGGWPPRAALATPNRVFVRHETQAGWCAVLNALPCPVLNRMPPAWWFDPYLYRAYLTQTFAQQLGLASFPIDGALGSPFPQGAPATARPAAVYAVGTQLVASSSTPLALQALLAERLHALANWQRETGIGFARIDFVRHAGYAVRQVDPMPTMGRAPAVLRESVGRLVAEALA